MLRLSALATLLVCLTYANAFGQQTRAELLEQQRAERARSVAPYTPNAVERALLYLDEKRIIERLGQELTGIYPRIGGFTTGSGFALGVGLRHALPGTNDFEVDAVGGDVGEGVQVRRLQCAGARRCSEAGWSSMAARAGGITPRRTTSGWASRSPPVGSDYRYLGLGVNLAARLRLLRHLWVGEEVGYLRPDIEDGTDDRFPSTRDGFTDEEAPGLTRQPRLVYNRTSVDLDYRDQPGNPRGGGRVLFQIGTGRDQDPSREFSYRRTDLEVMHVFPIFDKKRNFALRFAASHVDPLNAGGRVAFFLSPTIGGSHTVRSYRELRFRDATYVLLNGEYRWEAFSALDLALYWDGGDVGHHAGTDSPRRVQDRLGLRPAVQYRSPDLHADRHRLRRAAKDRDCSSKFNPAF